MKLTPALLCSLCSATVALLGGGLAQASETYTFGLIAKSQNNPIFQVARHGANETAKALEKKYGVRIKIDWRTPGEEDAQKQAQAIEQLVLAGADGIAVSCSDASKITDAINAAVKNGVPVATFDSDAPASKRFVTFGIDDVHCGEQLMEELARFMGGKGVVAILAGNPNAPNLQKRLQGVKDTAEKYPGIIIRDIYYNKETPQDGAAKVQQVMQANPDITGWAMIGSWPLYTPDALPWPPGSIKCVSVDAMPSQLRYIRSGHVQVLLAQQVYEWGQRSVEHLFNKVHLKKNPPGVRDVSPLLPVTRANVDAYETNWEKWLPK